MNALEQHFWNRIADTIEPHCVNTAGYIYDFVENEKCQGFVLKTKNEQCTIHVIGIDEKPLTQPIEESYFHLHYKDPPGTFEGISVEANT
jgi:hypothetical protein